MKIKKLIHWIIIFAIVIGLTLLVKSYAIKNTANKPFSTEKANRRHIVNIIKATGTLMPKDTLKIGSLVNGIISYLYVEENESVTEGQLLAEVDDGKEDTDVNNTFGTLDAAQASLTYQSALLKRQEALFSRNQISLDLYQQSVRDYETALAKVEQAKALYEQAKLVYDNKKIYAAVTGTIIAKGSSVGEAVTNFPPATVIYTIAKNIKEMKAELEVDESTIGNLKINTPVSMTFDTYPHKTFNGMITEISNNAIVNNGAVSYKATALIDNTHLLFRPGMTFTGRITVEDKENTLSVPSQIFKINRQALQQVAQTLGYSYQPLDKAQFLKANHQDNTKVIWIYKNNAFIETIVTIGTTDNTFFEITHGIDGTEDIIYDVIEPDSMKEFFGRFFGKGLNA